MNFNFRTQTPNVAFLLQVCNGVLANLEGQDKEQLELAMRSFEEVTTVVELRVDRVVALSRGDGLANSEVRLVLDLAASLIACGQTLETKLENLLTRVISLRPACGGTVLRELSATPGRAWVAVQAMQGDIFQVTAWDGIAKQPTMEVKGSYAAAKDRADELAEEIYVKRGQLLGAAGDVAWVVIPRQGTNSERAIDARSGIVAKRKGDRVHVYFEGNRMGAENLRHYTERVANAAGRLFKQYPTIARSAYSLAEFMDQFQVVGFCTDAYKIEIHNFGAVVAYAGKPGMTMPSGEELPYLMNEIGEWKKGAVTVTRNEVALAHAHQHSSELMGAI